MIIPSLLDTDHYKITMGQVVFNQFPGARVHYEFINRGRTPFPPGFAKDLCHEVRQLADLQATPREIAWLQRIGTRDEERGTSEPPHPSPLTPRPCFKRTYLEWLAHYRFNPEEVAIRQSGGNLDIAVEGPWYRTIFWEIPLLSLVSELYFRQCRPLEGWIERIETKAERMAAAGVHWADFGTRRRFSLAVQDKVNEVMSAYRPLFLGTSNPFLAMKYGLTPIGTYAHEAPMAMQALSGLVTCDKQWIDAWVREYDGDLGIALTDTLTTDYFLRSFGRKEAKLFDGVRQDSGQPRVIAERIIAHYQALDIDPRSKRIIFSDRLTDDSIIALHRQFSSRIMVSGGIGTYLTNDVGHQPLNIVIKLTAADSGHGFVPVVKLSDDAGKHTGDARRLTAVYAELGLALNKDDL
jgi:nicotinate phosphoribosyltransferase